MVIIVDVHAHALFVLPLFLLLLVLVGDGARLLEYADECGELHLLVGAVRESVLDVAHLAEEEVHHGRRVVHLKQQLVKEGQDVGEGEAAVQLQGEESWWGNNEGEVKKRWRKR